MAITVIEYSVLMNLRKSRLVPENPNILEIGQQNWYGDVPMEILGAHITEAFGDDQEGINELAVKLADIGRRNGEYKAFELVQFFYEFVFQHKSYTAVDMHGSPEAIRHNLNEPLELDRQYEIVTNIGTAEHVFNIYQVFKSIHDATVPGGLMIHSAPMLGWPDHGFFCFQPTLFFDLAEANDYQVVILAVGQHGPFKIFDIGTREQFVTLAAAGRIPKMAEIACVLKKGREEKPFQTPMQGVYFGDMPKSTLDMWRDQHDHEPA